jgi:hypothetical protein
MNHHAAAYDRLVGLLESAPHTKGAWRELPAIARAAPATPIRRHSGRSARCSISFRTSLKRMTRRPGRPNRRASP